MATLSRLFRHLRTTSRSGRKLFPPSTLQAVETAIAEGETRHRAEVRIVIEPSLSAQAVLCGVSARERARELFSFYRVWDTEENCGVLVYVNLADHKVEIVADRGVGRAVTQGEWNAVCTAMTDCFAHGDYHAGVLAAITRLHALLEKHYPDDGSTRNQLPDRPVLL